MYSEIFGGVKILGGGGQNLVIIIRYKKKVFLEVGQKSGEEGQNLIMLILMVQISTIKIT